MIAFSIDNIVVARGDRDVIRRGAEMKAKMRRIFVHPTNRGTHLFRGESGRPYFATLNVVINLERRNHSRMKVAELDTPVAFQWS
jgi:hypothetical protein